MELPLQATVRYAITEKLHLQRVPPGEPGTLSTVSLGFLSGLATQM